MLMPACKGSPAKRQPGDDAAPPGDAAAAVTAADPDAVDPAAVIGKERPRFSPDGRHIAFHGGATGARQIYVMNADGTGVRQVTRMAGDSRDPAWDPAGKRLVFANDAEGNYDLHVVPVAGGTPERITDWPGDEIEPAVAPIRFAFYAVRDDSCSGAGAGGDQVDGYEKIAFTRRHGARASAAEAPASASAAEEVWFVSMRAPEPGAVGWQGEPDALSAHAAHQGRLSPPGKRCGAPAFAGDGLSLVWTCDDGGPVIFDGAARWEQSFKAALDSMRSKPIAACMPEGYDEAACMAKLPRRYATYAGQTRSQAAEGLARPSVSTNQIMLVADAGGRPMHRDRTAKGARWQPFEPPARDSAAGDASADATADAGAETGAEIADVRNVVWSPDGTRIAFDAAGQGGREIRVMPTDFYLQEVRNLHRFPALHGKGRSRKLQDHRFVARPGEHKEFYALYEQLRYARQPQYVTADAALQAYRDELLRILRAAEQRASEHLRALSRALRDHYAARLATNPHDQHDRYYAAYFATAWVVLEAAATMPALSDDDYMELAYGGEPDPETMALKRPAMERLPAEIPRVLNDLPEALRGDVSARVQSMLAHAGVGDLAVPGRARPARIDWSQFKVRGPYAEGNLAGYFLAMSWYAQAPLPFDISLADLVQALDTVQADGRSALAVWQGIDAMVGAFMGKPVDPTVAHLVQVRGETPALLRPFDADGLTRRLEALRGPMPLRDAEAVEGDEAARKLQVTLFPKRMGLDTTYFRALTHPDVPMRGMPSALDAMAVLGSKRARRHAVAAAKEFGEAYQKALDKLVTRQRGAGLASTDIYHAWLAALVALATAHDVPADSLMTFARSNAWQDRLLHSALAGYTQLKHAAVLYNMQDMSAECGDDASYYLLVEQPIEPTPHGFVDPLPTFFEALAGLADRVYRDLHDDAAGPSTPFWGNDDDTPLNARNFARDLARIARREVEARPLDDADLRWIEQVGPRLEALTLNIPASDSAIGMDGEGRAQRGILLATDIHTNLMRQQVLQLAIGRIMDIYVAVPDGVGQTLTQGGIFSFYEFHQAMSDRLTDAQWAERAAAGNLPPRPAWTGSFVEDAKR